MVLEVERHLASQGRIPGTSFVLDSVLFHADGGAALEPTSAALVPVGLVDDAAALVLGFANVLTVPTNRSLEIKKAKKIKMLFKLFCSLSLDPELSFRPLRWRSAATCQPTDSKTNFRFQNLISQTQPDSGKPPIPLIRELQKTEIKTEIAKLIFFKGVNFQKLSFISNLKKIDSHATVKTNMIEQTSSNLFTTPLLILAT